MFDELLGSASSARRALRELAAARAALDGLEEQLVIRARAERWSWHSIARDLGLSGSTVHRRHAERDPRREHFERLRRERAEIWGPATP